MTFTINSTHIENDELSLTENANGNLVLEHKPTGQMVALNGAAVEIDTDLSLNSGETAVDYTNKEVPQTFLGGPAASLSAYPLVHGTDTDAPTDAHHTPPASDTDTQSGDGTATVFTIAHSLGSTPTAVSVQAESADAMGDFYVSNKTSTAVDITYASAPASGTSNLSWSVITAL